MMVLSYGFLPQWRMNYEEDPVYLAGKSLIDPENGVNQFKNCELNNVIMDRIETNHDAGCLASIVFLLVCVRVLDLLTKVQEEFKMYKDTVFNVLTTVIYYCIVLFVVFIAFALSAHIYYGDTVDEYSSFHNSLAAVILLIVKDKRVLHAMAK